MMSEKEKKSKAAPAKDTPSSLSEGVATQLIDELNRVHMRIPKF
jgi:hypothetical protein